VPKEAQGPRKKASKIDGDVVARALRDRGIYTKGDGKVLQVGVITRLVIKGSRRAGGCLRQRGKVDRENAGKEDVLSIGDPNPRPEKKGKKIPVEVLSHTLPARQVGKT